MSQASSTARRNRRVFCPNCGVLANCNSAATEGNFGRIFYKCPYYAPGRCQFFQCEDMMGQASVQKAPAPRLEGGRAAPILPVVHVNEAPAARGGRVHVAEAAAAAQGQGQMVDERILDKLKWIEKLVIVCILLLLYAIWK